MSDEPYPTEALARRCGVTVRTIHRWRKHSDFPAPVMERGRDDGGGHAWSFTDVRAWLDRRGHWDWATDRVFASQQRSQAPPPRILGDQSATSVPKVDAE